MTLRIDPARLPTTSHQGSAKSPPASHPHRTTPAGTAGTPAVAHLTLTSEADPPRDANAAAALARQTAERIARQDHAAVRAQAGISPDVVLRLLQD